MEILPVEILRTVLNKQTNPLQILAPGFSIKVSILTKAPFFISQLLVNQLRRSLLWHHPPTLTGILKLNYQHYVLTEIV